MEITHEAPHPDLSFTVRAPLELVCADGTRKSIERWALSGFAVDDSWDEVPETGELSIPFQGVAVRFPVNLKHDADQKFAFFEGLTGRQRETLALFYRNLLSGQMAATGDIITSIDTPVDLVPMGETEEEKKTGAKSKSRQALRIIYNLAIYVLMSYFVFAVLGGSVWTKFNTIDIQHGRIAAPELSVAAIDEGTVYDIVVRPGDRVKAGDRLIKIRDAGKDANEDKANLVVKDARAKLEAVRAAIAELEAVQNENADDAYRLALAARLHARYFRSSEFETAQYQWLVLRDENPELAASLDPVQTTLTRLRALAEQLAIELRTAKEVLKSRSREARALHVIAPTDGIVRAIFATEGVPVRGGDELIILESNAARVAVGWASERLAETLYVGMPAEISLNNAGQIVRAGGKITDLIAGEDPTRPGEFGIIVTVTADQMDIDQTRAQFRASAPVNLVADKRLLNRWTTPLKQTATELYARFGRPDTKSSALSATPTTQ